jgi:23S rRNA (uracil1939-C5)-methyltransferase
VNVNACPVHNERGNALAFAFRDRCQAAGIAAAGAPTDGRRARGGRASTVAGVLKGLAIRVGRTTGQMLATLVVSADTDKRLRTATRGLLASTSDVTGFHLNVHPHDDGFVFGAETRRIAGERRLREEVGGISFLISPTAFFQTNVRAAELLVGLVLEAITPDVPVIDLYAGAGLFAIPLARRGHRVVAVEENRAAVADAEATLRLNHLPADRCRFIARPVESALRSLDPAEAIVLDPPREGCSPQVVRAIFGTLRPRVAVYVSCDPETLARDLRAAISLGYRVGSVQPVDMFPHTPHIETVAVVKRL